MKNCLLALGLGLACFRGPSARALDIAVGNASTVAGGNAVIPIVISNAPTNLSALCFFLTNSAAFGLPSVAPGTAQSNVVAFVDDFSKGVYRVTAFVTNDPPIGNGTIMNLSYTVPPGVAVGTYPLALALGPPSDAPSGLNPEARSIASSDPIASTGANGFILIGAVTPPFLSATLQPATGALQVTFTNASGASFSVLATTNVALPLSNWTVIGGAVQVSSGRYQFTDASATNYAQRYYSVRGP